MNPKVSILVPVFNASEFIEKCAHSLFQQTFPDIEFIFVNDATGDDSIEKLEKTINQYPNQKAKIKIIHHQTNKGVAAARNTAIDNSTGDYISFVDSDDYIDINMIAELYNCATANNTDIIIFDAIIESNNKSQIISDKISKNKFENISKIFTQEISPTVWNKFVKKEFYKMTECRIPENLTHGEDSYLLTKIFYYAQNIIKLDKSYYHYNAINSLSMTKEIKEIHFNNAILFWNLTEKFLIEINEFEQYKTILEIQKARRRFILMMGTNDPYLRKKYISIFQEESIKHKNTFNKTERFFLWLLTNNYFKLYEFLHKLLLIKNKI